jgi:hypothetical protein
MGTSQPAGRKEDAMDHGSPHPEGALQSRLTTIEGKLDRILGVLDERRARRIPIARPGAGASVTVPAASRPPAPRALPAEPPAAVRCPRCEGDLVECRVTAPGAASRIEYACLCMDCGNHFGFSRVALSSAA